MHDGRDGPEARAEQMRYARLLDLTSKVGFAALVGGFAAYALGWLDAYVPVADLPQLWVLPLADYLARTQTPTGWAWLAHLHRADFAALLGIAMLAGCSLVCLLAIVPLYARRRDHTYVAICLLQVLVLLLAASGILAIDR